MISESLKKRMMSVFNEINEKLNKWTIPVTVIFPKRSPAFYLQYIEFSDISFFIQNRKSKILKNKISEFRSRVFSNCNDFEEVKVKMKYNKKVKEVVEEINNLRISQEEIYQDQCKEINPLKLLSDYNHPVFPEFAKSENLYLFLNSN